MYLLGNLPFTSSETDTERRKKKELYNDVVADVSHPSTWENGHAGSDKHQTTCSLLNLLSQHNLVKDSCMSMRIAPGMYDKSGVIEITRMRIFQDH